MSTKSRLTFNVTDRSMKPNKQLSRNMNIKKNGAGINVYSPT